MQVQCVRRTIYSEKRSACVSACMYVCMYVCISVSLCLSLCLSVALSFYIYAWDTCLYVWSTFICDCKCVCVYGLPRVKYNFNTTYIFRKYFLNPTNKRIPTMTGKDKYRKKIFKNTCSDQRYLTRQRREQDLY